jgi:hypothetical protein
MANALRKEQATVTFSPASVREKNWITARREIRHALREFSEEQIALFECAALTSWESR